MSRVLTPIWLGLRPYAPVLALQERLHEARAEGRIGDVALFLEHEPVVTFGRLVHETDLRVPRDVLRARGVEVVETGRGGNATFHGPGQLVGYPIVDLKPDRCDVRRYVGDLAATMIALAAARGIEAGMLQGEYLGVWVDRDRPERFAEEAYGLEKIGAIGVRISRWCTMHGFAFNATTDLASFVQAIFPCGISDKGITSLASLGVAPPPLVELAAEAADHLASRLALEPAPLRDRSHADLDAILDELL